VEPPRALSKFEIMGIGHYGSESGQGKEELKHRNPASGWAFRKNPQLVAMRQNPYEIRA
jgi:hypothetical protein